MPRVRYQGKISQSLSMVLGQAVPRSSPPCTCPQPEAASSLLRGVQGPHSLRGWGGLGSLALDPGLTGDIIPELG